MRRRLFDGSQAKYFRFPTKVGSTALALNPDVRNLHPSTVLATCVGLQASNPKDKIYGIQGIIRTGFFAPDYSKSTRDVYIDATVQMMDADLRVLLRVHHSLDYKAPQDHPSWMSTWDQTQSKRHGLITLSKWSMRHVIKRSTSLVCGVIGPRIKALLTAVCYACVEYYAAL
jgi:hypothetical protein